MEDGITASLYTYLTDLTVFAKSEGIPMGTHSLHKIERQHIKMPPLGAKVPDPYAPCQYIGCCEHKHQKGNCLSHIRFILIFCIYL